MITRAEVDALQYGDIVRLEIDGEVLEGPVEGQVGYKNVHGRALRLATADFHNKYGSQVRTETFYVFDGLGHTSAMKYQVEDTGYPEYVLVHGTLTVLEKANRG